MSLPVSPAYGVTVLPDNALITSSIDTVILRCHSEVELEVSYQWMFNYTLLVHEMSENLTLYRVSASRNGGNYSCNVNNAAGTGTYTTNLFFSPIITVNPADEVVFDNTSNVTFTCNAIAYPVPHYEWFKVNGVLPSTAVGGNTNSLIISPVVFGDEGTYYCRATANNMTIDSNRATLYSKFQRDIYGYVLI